MKFFITTLAALSLLFGASLAFAATGKVDHIRITVYYTEASGATGAQVRVDGATIVNNGGTLIVK